MRSILLFLALFSLVTAKRAEAQLPCLYEAIKDHNVTKMEFCPRLPVHDNITAVAFALFQNCSECLIWLAKHDYSVTDKSKYRDENNLSGYSTHTPMEIVITHNTSKWAELLIKLGVQVTSEHMVLVFERCQVTSPRNAKDLHDLGLTFLNNSLNTTEVVADAVFFYSYDNCDLTEAVVKTPNTNFNVFFRKSTQTLLEFVVSSVCHKFEPLKCEWLYYYIKNHGVNFHFADRPVGEDLSNVAYARIKWFEHPMFKDEKWTPQLRDFHKRLWSDLMSKGFPGWDGDLTYQLSAAWSFGYNNTWVQFMTNTADKNNLHYNPASLMAEGALMQLSCNENLHMDLNDMDHLTVLPGPLPQHLCN